MDNLDKFITSIQCTCVDDEPSFVDRSIFQGIVQYLDDQGVEWRREEDSFSWKFYKEGDNCFIYDGALRKTKYKQSIKGAHYLYEDSKSSKKE